MKSRSSRDQTVSEDWKNLKECITEVTEKICGKLSYEKKQSWMTIDILDQMKERKKLKINKEIKKDDDSVRQYKQKCANIQKMCRKAKANYYEEKCKEIEDLDRKHSLKIY